VVLPFARVVPWSLAPSAHTLVALSALASLGALGCGSSAAPASEQASVMVEPERAPSASAASSPVGAGAARAVGESEALVAGLVRFEGMVRPTKGGVTVRSVTFDQTAFERLAPKPKPGASSDWLLGAKVRITAELVLVDDSADPDDGVHVQRRAGPYFRARRLDAVELVREAAVLEGELSRSKGFFALGQHLVSHDDLAWSLSRRGAELEKLRVRLYGQPRVVVCDPGAQCLVGGELPLFDVGRAELAK
jgi:hypothetical protein